MRQIRCVLLDDELPGLSYLRMLCNQVSGVEVVKAYSDPLRLLSELGSVDADVYILDIQMPAFNGLEVAQRLQGKAVIFSTAYETYAADAFDLSAVDYIRKPYQLHRLEQAFLKAEKWLSGSFPEPLYKVFNSDQGKIRLALHEIHSIVTAENDRRDKQVTLKDGKSILIKNHSFEELFEYLPAHQFCRVNKKTVINILMVESYTHEWIHMLSQSGPEKQRNLSVRLTDAYREAFDKLLHA